MDRSTEIGGGARDFPATRWSVIRDASDRSSESFRASLAEFAAVYWRPVYSYLRRKWGKGNEEAKDLTQEFFASLSGTALFRNAAPESGRFRAYVMATLDNVVRMDRREREAQKRGGGVVHVPVEAFEPEAAADPEAAFDRDWMAALLDDALAELAREYRERKQEGLLRVFMEKEVEPPEPEPSYEELAAKHGLSVTDVRNGLYRAKQRLRELVRRRVRETVANDAEAEAEFRRLFEGGP
jgi:RNA polymerase sigma-70 factor (ECF subfamily)